VLIIIFASGVNLILSLSHFYTNSCCAPHWNQTKWYKNCMGNRDKVGLDILCTMIHGRTYGKTHDVQANYTCIKQQYPIHFF